MLKLGASVTSMAAGPYRLALPGKMVIGSLFRPPTSFLWALLFSIVTPTSAYYNSDDDVLIPNLLKAKAAGINSRYRVIPAILAQRRLDFPPVCGSPGLSLIETDGVSEWCARAPRTNRPSILPRPARALRQRRPGHPGRRDPSFARSEKAVIIISCCMHSGLD